MPSRYAHLLCLVLLDISLVPFQQCPCMLIVFVNLLMLSLACKIVMHAAHVSCSEANVTKCGRLGKAVD